MKRTDSTEEIFNYLKDVKKLDNARKHLIHIKWFDHYDGDHSWTDIEDVLKERSMEKHGICETCGFLIKEDKRDLTIALTVTETNELGTAFTIRKSCIISRIDFEL